MPSNVSVPGKLTRWAAPPTPAVSTLLTPAKPEIVELEIHQPRDRRSACRYLKQQFLHLPRLRGHRRADTRPAPAAFPGSSVSQKQAGSVFSMVISTLWLGTTVPSGTALIDHRQPAAVDAAGCAPSRRG